MDTRETWLEEQRKWLLEHGFQRSETTYEKWENGNFYVTFGYEDVTLGIMDPVSEHVKLINPGIFTGFSAKDVFERAERVLLPFAKAYEELMGMKFRTETHI